MIKHVLDKLPTFIRAAHCEENGVPSSRRMQFTAVVACTLLIIIFDVVMHCGLRAESIDLSKFLIGIIAAYVTGTRIADK